MKKSSFQIKAISIFMLSFVVLVASAGSGAVADSGFNNSAVESVSGKIRKLGFKDSASTRKIAFYVNQESSRHEISPGLILAMMKVESSFNQNAVSASGDISVAQINIKTWNQEFKRLNRRLIDSKRLKGDPAYAIARMAEILSIIKAKRVNDKDWYSVYHSKTPSIRMAYLKRVKKELALIE